MRDDLMSVHEAARRLGLSERQVRHLVDKGALEAVRVQIAGAKRPLVGIPSAGVATAQRTSAAE